MISKELILQGTKFRKTVHLTVYNEDIEIKPLTEIEIAKVFKKVESTGFSTVDPKLSDNYILQLEACRYGIVDPKLHEKVEVDDVDNPGSKKSVEVFELMMGNALMEIGREVISISTVDSKELSDFFKCQKVSDLSGSITQDTESLTSQ